MDLFLDKNIFPSSPKDLNIVECKPAEACEYNARWHSRLPKLHPSNVWRNRHYICFRAEYKEQVFAVGIWSSPIARFSDYDSILELRRLAISPEAPKFTATYMLGKMIKYIKKNMKQIERLISYQDTEVHSGTIYKAGNWEPTFYSKRKGKTWNSRKRNKEQTMVDKIRWEYFIKRRNT